VGMDSRLIEGFPFFRSEVKDQVLQLGDKTRREAEGFFISMVEEHFDRRQLSGLRIAALLLQLFITVQRDHFPVTGPEAVSYNSIILRNFRDLIDTHFGSIRLPKDYAAMLYITPNHLNALCKDLLGVSAGQLIRDRIVLESKRLLSNFELPIGEIARELNFPDSSYFVKFFKKYTGTTPEIFRKRNLYDSKS
jgi:AraC family transcriptional activator of pobA